MFPLCLKWRLLSRDCVSSGSQPSLWWHCGCCDAQRLPGQPWLARWGAVTHTRSSRFSSWWKEWRRLSVATNSGSILMRQSIRTDHVWPRLLYFEAFSYCTFHLASFWVRVLIGFPIVPSWLMWSRGGGKKMKGVDGWHCLLCLWGRALAKLLRGSTSWHRRLPRCGCQRPQALDSVSVCLILFVRRETAVGSTADVRVHPPQWRLSAIFFQRVLFFFCCLRCQKSDDGWLWHLVLSLESLKWWDGHFST